MVCSNGSNSLADNGTHKVSETAKRGTAAKRRNERTQSLIIHACTTVLHTNFQIDGPKRLAADSCRTGTRCVHHIHSDPRKATAGEFDRVLNTHTQTQHIVSV